MRYQGTPTIQSSRQRISLGSQPLPTPQGLSLVAIWFARESTAIYIDEMKQTSKTTTTPSMASSPILACGPYPHLADMTVMGLGRNGSPRVWRSRRLRVGPQSQGRRDAANVQSSSRPPVPVRSAARDRGPRRIRWPRGHARGHPGGCNGDDAATTSPQSGEAAGP